jgi:hypothetical protein
VEEDGEGEEEELEDGEESSDGGAAADAHYQMDLEARYDDENDAYFQVCVCVWVGGGRGRGDVSHNLCRHCKA